MARMPKHLVEKNETLFCSAPGCLKRRYRLNTLCAQHVQKRARQGHPTVQSLLTGANNLVLREKAREIITRNIDHPGIQEALRQIDHWIQNANPTINGGVHKVGALLREREVEPQEVLVALAKVWIAATLQPENVPDSRTRDTQAGKAVCKTIHHKLWRWNREVGVTFLLDWPRHVGEFLAEGLTRILLSIALVARDERDAEALAQSVQMIPLKPKPEPEERKEPTE
jgi:hypothetical protein